MDSEKKLYISQKIKNITIKMIDDEINKLKEIGINSNTITSQSRIGTNIVNYFTFHQRLEAKGRKKGE